VITRIPKKRKIRRIGMARIVVTKATSGVEIPYPIQPPPLRIAVWPVPLEPLRIWSKPVMEISRTKVPIIIRPVAFE
jgi:hypothetical protein